MSIVDPLAWSSLVISTSNGVDDTSAIQQTLNLGGEIIFRSGTTYWVNGVGANGNGGLFPVSGSRIIIERGATIRCITNSSVAYRIFNFDTVSGWTLEVHGDIIGDLDTHTGTTGQFGHGIYITDGCSDFAVIGEGSVSKCWGDGLYIGALAQCTDGAIDGLTLHDNRRNGAVVVHGQHIEFRHCIATDAGVTAHARSLPQGPSAGFDLEPNTDQTVDRVTFHRCISRNCEGAGWYCSSNGGTLTNLRLDSCESRDAGGGDATAIGENRNLGVYIGTSTGVVVNNLVASGVFANPSDPDANRSSGLMLNGVTRGVVTGGRLHHNGQYGLFVFGGNANNISGVICDNNTDRGVVIDNATDTSLTGLTVVENVGPGRTTRSHLSVLDSTRTTINASTFRGPQGKNWVEIDSESVDTAATNNVGIRTIPTDGAYSDDGTGTFKANNYSTSTGDAW